MHNRNYAQNSKKKNYFELFSFMSNLTTRSLRRKTTTEESTTQQANLPPRPRRSVKRTVSASPVQVVAEAQDIVKHQDNGEVAELRKMVQELSKEKMPIILDEAFAYYDTERLENILKYINEKFLGHQIMIFTCTNREKEILKESFESTLKATEITFKMNFEDEERKKLFELNEKHTEEYKYL